jgi:protein phosphatase PTC7
MRRPLLRKHIARATYPEARRRTFFQSTSTCRPDLTEASATPDTNTLPLQRGPLPFVFETGVALYAKRAPRPFPPPFLSRPSGSFSDPLSTHHRSRDRRATVNGELIRGLTNGDDAVYASKNFIAANDGVGAWSTRPGGHAGYVVITKGNQRNTAKIKKSLVKVNFTLLGSGGRTRCESNYVPRTEIRT